MNCKEITGGYCKSKRVVIQMGLCISVEKTKTVFFTRKIVSNEIKLKLYNEEFERVKHFRFSWLDERTTWAVHIHKLWTNVRK